jgi:EAL domain-containing protein (putative c-di-GMP-specific phosphodiesterase class I)
VAEETGLIVAIGDLALQKSCTDFASWFSSGRHKIDLLVNISSRQCMRESFPDIVKRILRETGLKPGRLCLEINENLLSAGSPGVFDSLELLRVMGVRLIMDDFGTGYSSLTSLRHQPVDILKIDRHFMGDLLEYPDETGIVDAVISLGRSLGLVVVGEGVEDPGQVEFLLSRGCSKAQGNLFCKPLPGGEFRKYLDGRNSADRVAS